MKSESASSNKSVPPIMQRGNFGRNMGVTVKPKDAKKTFKRLWQYIKPEKIKLFFIFILVIISSIMALTIPYITGKCIDTIANKSGVEFKFLKGFLLCLLGIYVGDSIINFINSYGMASISQRIVKNLRNSIFFKLQKLPISFFDTHTHGEIMSRLTNDIDNVSNTLSQAITQLMSGSLMIIGSLITMIILSPMLTVASLVTVPLLFILTKTVSRRTKIFFKNQQIELGKLNGYVEESMSGFQVVKAFNYEHESIEKFNKVNESLYKEGLKAQIWSGFLMPLMNVINNLGFTMLALVGGFLASKDIITIGVIQSFIIYSKQFTRPLNDLANIYNTLQSALAGAERVFEILDEKEEIEDKINCKKLENVDGRVEFKNVSFSYNEDKQILKDVSFLAEKGDTIALVGPTGAGKTTIVNLITRFYEVSKGSILIDDLDITDYNRESLREAFSIVLQDTYLFNGSIKENIAYGNLNAKDDDIIKAAKLANAHEFIKKLPKGYDTILSESGENLSSGERQLLAIARAILKDSPILILDEATSNVDTITELKIQEALLNLMKGRTSFIIAHRLSTIRNANTIMVIDNGRIAEKGSHEELIDKRGIYYNMYFSQYSNIFN